MRPSGSHPLGRRWRRLYASGRLATGSGRARRIMAEPHHGSLETIGSNGIVDHHLSIGNRFPAARASRLWTEGREPPPRATVASVPEREPRRVADRENAHASIGIETNAALATGHHEGARHDHRRDDPVEPTPFAGVGLPRRRDPHGVETRQETQGCGEHEDGPPAAHETLPLQIRPARIMPIGNPCRTPNRISRMAPRTCVAALAANARRRLPARNALSNSRPSPRRARSARRPRTGTGRKRRSGRGFQLSRGNSRRARAIPRATAGRAVPTPTWRPGTRRRRGGSGPSFGVTRTRAAGLGWSVRKSLTAEAGPSNERVGSLRREDADQRPCAGELRSAETRRTRAARSGNTEQTKRTITTEDIARTATWALS